MQGETLIATASGASSATYVTENRARMCGELLAEFRSQTAAHDAALIDFLGVDGRDVYNVTAPFTIDGQRLIAGRVEHRSTELSDVIIFRETRGEWRPCFTSSVLKSLQDPCVAIINDEIILGGVKYPVPLNDGSYGWQMEFFRGRSLSTLRPFLRGPARMKDIRFCGLPDGRVAVFTRPQGLKGGRGKIGFAVAASLNDVTAELIERAPLIPSQFAAGEWGGANEAHVLNDGTLGVLGHIACWDMRGNRHYYPMAFTIDPDTMQTTPIRIIARRDIFPDAPAKRADLADVVFTGGLLRNGDGTALLYAGLSDAAAGVVRLVDPFLTQANSAVA